MELEVLQKVLTEVLNVDKSEIHMDTTFLGDLGADSLDVFQIVFQLQDILDVQFDEKKVEKIRTVGEAVQLIHEAIEDKK